MSTNDPFEAEKKLARQPLGFLSTAGAVALGIVLAQFINGVLAGYLGRKLGWW